MVDEPGRRLLANELSSKSVTVLRAGESCQQRRFDQALKIDHSIVILAQVPQRRRKRSNAGHDFDQLPIGGPNDPVNVVMLPKSDDGGNRVNDIAKRGQADDKQALHLPRIFSRIALVECSFASPQIAIRPNRQSPQG